MKRCVGGTPFVHPRKVREDRAVASDASNGAAPPRVRSCRLLLNCAARPPPPSPYHLGLQSRRGGSAPPPTHLPPLSPPKMPRYELALILKAMQRPETAATLKRTVEALMERGAVVRNLENLGERALPFKISKHSQRHTKGGYFLVDFEAPPTAISAVTEHFGRDIDIIRSTILKHHVARTQECVGIIPINYEDKLLTKTK